MDLFLRGKVGVDCLDSGKVTVNCAFTQKPQIMCLTMEKAFNEGSIWLNSDEWMKLKLPPWIEICLSEKIKNLQK